MKWERLERCELINDEKTIVLLGIAILTLITGLSVAGLSRAEEDAYSRGYSDAVADAHYEHGHGYDSSCPSGHSEAYCKNYQSGYATGWRSVTTTQTQGGAPKGVCPRGMYLDQTLGIYHCHDAAGTHDVQPANITSKRV